MKGFLKRTFPEFFAPDELDQKAITELINKWPKHKINNYVILLGKVITFYNRLLLKEEFFLWLGIISWFIYKPITLLFLLVSILIKPVEDRRLKRLLKENKFQELEKSLTELYIKLL